MSKVTVVLVTSSHSAALQGPPFKIQASLGKQEREATDLVRRDLVTCSSSAGGFGGSRDKQDPRTGWRQLASGLCQVHQAWLEVVAQEKMFNARGGRSVQPGGAERPTAHIPGGGGKGGAEGGQGSEVGRERVGGQGGVLRHSEKMERPG